MNTFKIIEIIGKNLNQDLIKFMVDQRIKEYGENTKDFEHNEQESTFFFLNDGNEIKAFGMLKPVVIYVDSKEYQIMGMANVISVEKSKGYGSILMDHVKKYLEKNRFACIGNTHRVNFDFYTKCGFTFIPGLVERFIYFDKNGKHKPDDDWTDYSMFIYDKANQLATLIQSSNEIGVKVPLW